MQGEQERGTMRAETFLAELNRLRQDLDEDPTDIEWLTLHHVFCFISYKMGDFQAYIDEQAERGAFDQFQG
ncbi:MAG TPA: hypothetical protein ENJ00_02570 [Phycisphaerales bacterium]|nr:hypothetical protein [Phycisphaerales bacterium]